VTCATCLNVCNGYEIVMRTVILGLLQQNGRALVLLSTKSCKQTVWLFKPGQGSAFVTALIAKPSSDQDLISDIL
jgi:hypothetical protein